MTTIIINIDKESSLAPLLELVKKLHLKAKVITGGPKASDSEHEEWSDLSAQNLNAAYGEKEPDYDLSMVKEPNPEYRS